jgi:hypothetical protein
MTSTSTYRPSCGQAILVLDELGAAELILKPGIGVINVGLTIHQRTLTYRRMRERRTFSSLSREKPVCKASRRLLPSTTVSVLDMRLRGSAGGHTTQGSEKRHMPLS